MLRLASIALAALVAACAGVVLATSLDLPALVATHFADGGRPDRWTSREVYTTSITLLVLLLPTGTAAAIAWLPLRWPRLVKPCFRDYWLAPARREATAGVLAVAALAVGALTAAMLGFVHVAVVEANRRTPSLADAATIAIPLAFGAAIVAIALTLAFRFRVPKAGRR